MNGVVIGLVGEQGSGKEALWSAICKVARENGIFAYARYSTSVVLRKMLEDMEITGNRDNLTALVKFLETTCGEGEAMRKVLRAVRSERPTIRVIDSIRMLADETALRAESNNILLHITAPPLIRLDRVRKRGEKPGEKELSLEKFMEQEKSHTEKHVPEIGSRANWKIVNDGTLEELTEKVREFFAKVVMPMLRKTE